MKDFDQSSAESREMANSFQTLKGGDSWTTTVSAPTRSNGSCGSKSLHSDVSFTDAKASECGSTLKVHDYIGLSEVSSHPSDDDLRASDDCHLNFGETELKLGLSLTAAPAGFQCKDVALGRAPGPFQDIDIADEYSPTLSNACLSMEALYRMPPQWVRYQDRGSLLYNPMKVPEMRGGGNEYQCSGVWSRGSEHWVSQDSRFNVEKSADVSNLQNSFCPRGFAECDFQAPAGQNMDGIRSGYGIPVSGFSGCKPVITARNTTAGTKRRYIQAIGLAKANPAVQSSEKQQCPSFVNWNLGSRRSSYPSGMNITMTDLGIDSGLVSWDGLKPSGQENAEQRPGNEHVDEQSALAEDSSTSPKSPVVGWPPIRSYRKNTLAAHPRCPEDEQEVVEAGNFVQNQGNSFYVKVNMEGVPIGRKVDLNAYNTYETLALALEDMFQLTTSCENGAQTQHNASSASKPSRLLDGSSDYMLTHEDKEGDWMLVGDVPWGMFVNTVKRLRIVKTAEANGIAPTCPEHVQNRQKSQAT